MPKKILITGGSGYLAGPLACFLEQSGHEVLIGTRDPEKLKSLPALKHIEKIKFDMLDRATVDKATGKVDTLIHLAAMSARDCEKDPSLAKTVNVDQVKYLYDVAANSGVKDIIYFSTVHVYGACLSGRLREDSVTNPVSVYAKTHLDAENSLKSKIDLGNVRGTILRMSNIVGAPIVLGPEAVSLISNLVCKQAISDKKITLKSSGRALRDFVSMFDLHTVVLGILHGGNRGHTIINVGSGKAISVLDLVQMVRDRCQILLGYMPGLETQTDSLDQKSFNLDVTRCNEILGNKGTGLVTAIDSTLLFFKYLEKE